MAKNADYFPLKPVNVSKQTWFYIERRGLNVVHQVRDPQGGLLTAAMFYLPWSKLIKAVNQHFAVQREKGKRPSPKAETPKARSKPTRKRSA